MDTTLIVAGLGMVIGAVILSFSVERLMRRLGVHPADPAERSGGFSDVLQRLKQWSRKRSSEDRK